MMADLLSINGEVKEKVEVPENLFSVPVDKGLLWEVVRYYLARHRQGTAKTKTRGEVSGGGRKPWRQKHTGRARHGSIRSPIWRGGGVVFGPIPRDYDLSIPKQKRRSALLSALSWKFTENKIKFLEDFSLSQPKTKEFTQILKNLGVSQSSLLFLLAKLERNLKLSSRNIPNLTLMPAHNLNAYEVLRHEYLIFTKQGFEHFTERFKKQ